MLIVPDGHHDPDTALDDCIRYNTSIKDAVDAASRADQEVADALRKPSINVDTNSLEDATAQQFAAVTDALNAIRETLPQGQSPDVVQAWWDSLSVDRREQLICARRRPGS
ncbi:hypothetical protein AB0M34_09955 [Nocardia sp. NPDC050193]